MTVSASHKRKRGSAMSKPSAMTAIPELNRSSTVRLMNGVYLLGSSPRAAAKRTAAEDEQSSRCEAETGPFDLLAGDPRRFPAKPDDLAREDRQQDGYGQDALQILVDAGNC